MVGCYVISPEVVVSPLFCIAALTFGMFGCLVFIHRFCVAKERLARSDALANTRRWSKMSTMGLVAHHAVKYMTPHNKSILK